MTSKFVLIIDDEIGLAEAMAALLRDEGYDTAIAGNGQIGVEMLDDRTPDLVLTDVMMPGLDGIGVLRHMRSVRAFADVPVVLMTALRQSLPDVEPPQHQGVLIKPFTHHTMFGIVRRLLN